MEFDVDPLFKNMTARFNETGARGLLLNNLPIDKYLDILLESKESKPEVVMNTTEFNPHLFKIIQSSFNCNDENEDEDFEKLEIFPKLDYFKDQINKICEEPEQRIEKSFKEITKKRKKKESISKLPIFSLREIDVKEEVNDKDMNGQEEKQDNQDNLENKEDEIKEEHEEKQVTHFIEEKDVEMMNSKNNVCSYLSDEEEEEEIGSINSNEINDIICDDDNNNINNEEADYKNSQLEDNTEPEEQATAPNLLDKLRRRTPKKPLEEFEFIRPENIKDHIAKFGDGSKAIVNILPRLKRILTDCTKNESKIKQNFLIPNKKKKNKKKPDLFLFDEDEEVTIDEIFNMSKHKVLTLSDFHDEDKLKDKKKNKKIQSRLFYDCNMMFSLFMIPEKKWEIMENHSMVEDFIKEEVSPEGLPLEEIKSGFNLDITMGSNLENIARVDKDYQNKYGRLYKTFDVRYLKGKIWESCNENKKRDMQPISFKNIIESVTQNISFEVKSNISTQTCFVCLLHLANEKNLSLEEHEFDNSNFNINF